MDMIRRLTVASVLAFLDGAGEAGATTTEIALAHDYPVSYHQRSNRVSQVMLVLRNRGWAEPAGLDRSPLYRHNPVNRWRVTAAGEAAYAEDKAAAQARDQARRAAAARREAALAAGDGPRAEALAAARREIARQRDSAGGITPAWRAAKIIELRQVPCTLDEIGQLFGLTKERVRQIEMRYSTRYAWCKQPARQPDPAAS
jgi:hypothetical protein